MNQAQKRTFFTKEDDLALAREVAGHNPFEDTNRRTMIQTNLLQMLGKSINVRTLKDRIRNLIKKYQNRASKEMFKSGTEEEIDELDDLIQHIMDLSNEFVNKKFKKNESDSYQAGSIIRENASTSAAAEGDNTMFFDSIQEEVAIIADKENEETETMEKSKSDNCGKKNFSERKILTPTRKRNGGLKTTTLNYLQKKNDRWYEIQNRQLELQERQKVLDEKRFELENIERTTRLELETQKENMYMDLLRNQQKMLGVILNKITPENLCNH